MRRICSVPAAGLNGPRLLACNSVADALRSAASAGIPAPLLEEGRYSIRARAGYPAFPRSSGPTASSACRDPGLLARCPILCVRGGRVASRPRGCPGQWDQGFGSGLLQQRGRTSNEPWGGAGKIPQLRGGLLRGGAPSLPSSEYEAWIPSEPSSPIMRAHRVCPKRLRRTLRTDPIASRPSSTCQKKVEMA